jgi:2-methylcitrate dehydratase PrpD
MADPPTAATSLGAFVATSDWDTISPEVRHEARRALLNHIGCALGAARTPPIDMALRALLPLSGVDRVGLIGRGERLDAMSAAFINAISSNLLDYDDTHLRTVIHPAAPVAPPALAMAEQRNLSGAALLHAFILGVEVACRIGNAVSPGHYDRGWHITSTCGVFGAAAAAARMCGLDSEMTAHAIGIAASQSAGMIENLSSAAKNVSVGNAARNGLFAALLAEQGYTAVASAIEGRFGWARAMGDMPVVDEITDDLGQRWELLGNTYKPYPCGIVMHAVVDACLSLRQQHAPDPSAIAEVEISGDQLLLDRGDRVVNGERDARVSIQHCAAVALLFGAAGPREFSEATVHDPMVAALRARVRARLDPASPRGAAAATLRLVDGRTLTASVPHAKGSLEAPLSDGELETKLRNQARHADFVGPIDAIIEALWRIDTLSSLQPLLAMLRGA